MEILTDIAGQIGKWPVAVVLGACLNLLGLWIKSLEFFPNKYIPGVVVFGGVIGYAFLGDISAISPNQHYPRVLLGLYGFLIGAAAWLLHNRLLYKFEPWLDKIFGKKPENPTP